MFANKIHAGGSKEISAPHCSAVAYLGFQEGGVRKFLRFCLKVAHFGCIFLPYAISFFHSSKGGGMAQVAQW